MKARVKLAEGMTFVGESGSGHAVVIDANPEIGGRDLGARPMELVLMGTGACSAVDVVLILRRSRQEVVDCVVELDGERASEDPKVFTRIHFHFVVTGKGLSPSHVERAIRLSREKYCSATAMMAKTAQITSDYEIREA
jgi:putative redox protein